MKSKKIDFSHSNYSIIDVYSKSIGKFKYQKYFSEELIKSCDIGLSSVMVSKKLMNKKLFSNLKTKEDYLLWINLIKHTKLFLVLIKT